MSAQPATPIPLRGPLGLREVFFTRLASEVLGSVRVTGRSVAIAAAVCVLALVPIGWIYHQLGFHSLTDEIPIAQLACWIGFEAACLLYGLRFSWLGAQARRSRHLAELALTGLRPVEIAQWFIARHMWPLLSYIVFLTVGCALIQQYSFVDSPGHIIPIVLIGINTWLTLYMMGWMQFGVFISAPSLLRAIWRQLMFVAVYCLIAFWLAMAWYGLALLTNPTSEITGVDFALLIPVVLAFWYAKYRLARAWAAQIERSIMWRTEM